MATLTVSAPSVASPTHGIVALLKAMGLSAVQVSAGVVALQTKPAK